MRAGALVVAACGLRWHRAALLGAAAPSRRARHARTAASPFDCTPPVIRVLGTTGRSDIRAATAAGRAAGRPITYVLPELVEGVFDEPRAATRAGPWQVIIFFGP